VTLAEWSSFFSAQTASFAALTGLVFVALSINLKTIIEQAGMPGRAAEAIIALVEPVLLGLAGLIGHQSDTALGVEWLVIGTLGWVSVCLILFRAREAIKERPADKIFGRIAGTQIATLPFIVAGALLASGLQQGFYWQAAGVAFCLLVGIQDAWILLVEILR
jgi:hypothetical protein